MCIHYKGLTLSSVSVLVKSLAFHKMKEALNRMAYAQFATLPNIIRNGAFKRNHSRSGLLLKPSIEKVSTYNLLVVFTLTYKTYYVIGSFKFKIGIT